MKGRQPRLLFGASFIVFILVGSPRCADRTSQRGVPTVYVIKILIRPSLLGCDKNGFGGATACGSFGPINSASNLSCWRNVRIISGDGGGDLCARSSAGSRCEKLKTKIKTQTAASPAQIRRLGQMSSSQNLFEQQRNQVTKLDRWLCSFVAWLFNSRTISCRIASSFGAAARCRSSKISRGVFMIMLWWGASLRARRLVASKAPARRGLRALPF